MTTHDDEQLDAGDPGPTAERREPGVAGREPDGTTASATDPLALEAEVARLNDQLLRALADVQNLRKRFDRERIEVYATAGDAVLLELLPVLDELDRAVAHLPASHADDDWARGVVHIRANLEAALKRLDVLRFGAAGEAYDALRHEAISRAAGPTDTIVEVYESGYERGGRILRPARVIVGSTDQVAPSTAPLGAEAPPPDGGASPPSPLEPLVSNP